MRTADRVTQVGVERDAQLGDFTPQKEYHGMNATTLFHDHIFLRYRDHAGQAAAGAARRSRKVRTPQGKVVEESTRGNPRESATESKPPMEPSHVNGSQARLKRCGKSAPASRRRDGSANPTRCKARLDRLQAARRGPGRPRRWMAAQRQNPAYRPATEKPRSGGVFLWAFKAQAMSDPAE